MGTMLFFSVAIKDLAATKILCLFYLDRKAKLEHATKITSKFCACVRRKTSQLVMLQLLLPPFSPVRQLLMENMSDKRF